MSDKRWTTVEKRRLASSTKARELEEAVARLDWDEVQAWLEVGASQDLSNPLLHGVISQTNTLQGHPPTQALNRLTILLDRFGQDLHERSRTGFTPLRCAVLYAPVEVLDLVLQRGANPNERYPRGVGGVTPWLELFAEGSRPMSALKAERLWRAGTDIDARVGGRTALDLLHDRQVSMPNDANLLALEAVWHQAHEEQVLRATLDRTTAESPLQPARPTRRL